MSWINNAKKVNGQYYSLYSNGGSGKLPVIADDQVTTDQMVVRTQTTFPSQQAVEYFDPTNKSSLYNLFQQQRVASAGSYLQKFRGTGVKVVGLNEEGKYNEVAAVPDPTLTVVDETQSTSMMLWVLIIIGGISIISHTVAPYP